MLVDIAGRQARFVGIGPGVLSTALNGCCGCVCSTVHCEAMLNVSLWVLQSWGITVDIEAKEQQEHDHDTAHNKVVGDERIFVLHAAGRLHRVLPHGAGMAADPAQ